MTLAWLAIGLISLIAIAAAGLAVTLTWVANQPYQR